jgi:hypothetical protein
MSRLIHLQKNTTMKNIKYKIIYVSVFFLALLINSCEKETEVEKIDLSRFFRPVGFLVSVNGTDLSFQWTGTGEGLYALELSKDSLLFTNELREFAIENTDELMVGNLWSQTRYSARVKAVSKNPAVTKDSEWRAITFVTGVENIFYAISNENIGVNSVMLKWNKAKDVSRIVISSAGAADVTVTLTAAEISAGEKLIGGLKAGTLYTFKIYLGTMLRGTISAVTNA